MNNKEIQSFIDGLIYDLETIHHLQEFNRYKETIPIVDLIGSRIAVFQQRINERPDDLKGLFEQDFWEKQVISGQKMGDIRVKVSDLLKGWSSVSNDDLKKLNYERFVLLLESWIFKNIALLQKRMKSELQKKIETTVMGALGVLVFVGLIWAGILYLITKDWGLQGDFYAGEHFEKYVCTEFKKTLDFNSPQEMSGKISQDHFSVRWQGDLLVDQEGLYTISEEVDDSGKISIDGQVLIEAWQQGRFPSPKTIVLSKGLHKIEIEYVQVDGPACLKLYWAKKDHPQEIIQAKYLRHRS